jgi:hypothetical protein
MRRKARKGIPLYKLGERRAARHRADGEAEEEAGRRDDEAKAEVASEQAKIDVAWQRLGENDPDIVMPTLEHAFDESQWPAAPLGCHDGSASLLMRFPTINAVVPQTEATTTPTGRESLKTRTASERNVLYADAIYGWALATAKRVFATAPKLDEVKLLAIEGEEPGRPYTTLVPLYAGHFTRAGFAGVNWTDGAARIASRFPGVVNITGRTHEVSPLDLRSNPQLRPVVEKVAHDLSCPVDPRCG